LVLLLDRLEIEHQNHAGMENAYLSVSYDQFEAFGIGRQYIKRAIAKGEELGLLEVTHRGAYTFPIVGELSTYRLTYLHWKVQPAIGAPQYMMPTHEWRAYKPPRRKKRAPPRRKHVIRLVHQN
jgi:hypothetical protein